MPDLYPQQAISFNRIVIRQPLWQTVSVEDKEIPLAAKKTSAKKTVAKKAPEKKAPEKPVKGTSGTGLRALPKLPKGRP
jgi:hypothetical protein